ncbi:ankyrin repeat-containing domain protein [Xylaria arbuscula]|nr:ankyrin repeat-containing domain protein [Xylaria arbuscula]
MGCHEQLSDFHRSLFKGFAMRHGWQCLMILASRFASSIDHNCLAILFCSLRATSERPRVAFLSERLTDDFEPVSRVVRKLLDTEHDIATHMLCRVDVTGQLPVHYATKSGFDISTAIPNALDEETTRAFLLDSMLSEDDQGLTPLHLATIDGHTSIITNFFDMLSLSPQHNKSHQVNVVAAACLNIAIKSGNDRLVKKLSDWADTQNMPAQGQSAFHIAARAGRCDYMRVLVNASAPESLNLNIIDSHGRTPLIDASVRGHILIVELLLEAGADPFLMDNSGWTARKYAVHRGHLTTAELLPKPGNSPVGKLRGSITTSPPASTSLNTAFAFDGDSQKHALVIYLGGRPTPELYHLEISVSHRNKQFQTINFPLLEDQSSKPLFFQLEGETEPHLLIRLFKDDIIDESGPSLLAAGVVSLHSTSVFCGHHRESLIREHTVILLDRDSQESIGTVLLTCVTARSFGYLQNQVPTVTSALHKSGFGQNVASRRQLQLGENTIGKSFMAAADHGAAFVEFDAQVTRDLETVIYHDFSLSETGTDIPIHDLTIDQYKYASSVQTPQGSPLIAPDEQTMVGRSAAIQRSRSFNGQKDVGALLIKDRLKHTVDVKSKAMKPNTRGDVIQELLVTLPELLQRLPPQLGLNIEIKYPRLHEAIEAGVAPLLLRSTFSWTRF